MEIIIKDKHLIVDGVEYPTGYYLMQDYKEDNPAKLDFREKQLELDEGEVLVINSSKRNIYVIGINSAQVRLKNQQAILVINGIVELNSHYNI